MTDNFAREFCPFCDEIVRRRPPDYVDECPEHGVLEGISDEEWITIMFDRYFSKKKPVRFWQVRFQKGDDFGVNPDSWRVFIEGHSPELTFSGNGAENHARELCFGLRLFEKFWDEKYSNKKRTK